MAPPSSNASRPGRALAVLVALIVVLLLAILGSDLASPGGWSKNFRVHLGLPPPAAPGPPGLATPGSLFE